MQLRLQFVDSIAAAPTVRLDLHSTVWSTLYGTRFDPPPIRRSLRESMLADGGAPSASTYGNRTIRLQLQLPSDYTEDEAATAQQTLMRELDREGNILRYQPGTTAPVFFRTFRTPPDSFDFDPTNKELVISVLAEPFAIGLRETVTPVTVSNDPAAGTNPASFDVTGVKGDVETPLLMVFTGTGTGGVGGRQSVIAVRRRGDPTALAHVVQAEVMTPIGADSTVSSAGADAAMSGATNNYIRTTFATNAILLNRASDSFPANGTAIVDARGTYRVFAHYRKSGAGTAGDMTVQLAYGDATATEILNPSVNLPAGAGPAFVDLGLIGVPLGADPDGFGYGTSLKALMNTIVWRAGRNSGALSLDLDYLYLMPAGPEASNRLCLIDWPAKDTTYAVDGINDAAYAMNSATDTVLSAEAAVGITGGLPMVSPNQTNRVYLIRDVTPGVLDTVSNTTVVAPYYWPLYQSVRPPTS